MSFQLSSEALSLVLEIIHLQHYEQQWASCGRLMISDTQSISWTNFTPCSTIIIIISTCKVSGNMSKLVFSNRKHCSADLLII